MQDKGDELREKLRKIPSIEEILESIELQDYIHKFSHQTVAETAREVVSSLRKKLMKKDKEEISSRTIIKEIERILSPQEKLFTKPVINGTGVILHTNFGRAPLGEDLLNHVKEISKNYCTLEYDLKLGKRGERTSFLEKLICKLTNAEGSLVVNNNAAAVLLILTGLAKGKEAIVSRGELVQIGGGFKVPEIMAQSSAILKEVGTTNRATLVDYAHAICENTALLLKVHHSNFKMIGFTEEVGLRELVKLGKENNIPVIQDLGSGALLPTEDFGLAHEPTAQDAINAGVDLVSFSGDKLLGGPQSGIILGKKNWIEVLRKHPLYRALRVDKIVIAGLENLILTYLKKEATEKIPAWRMMNTSLDELKSRAQKLKRKLEENDIKVSVSESKSTVGGGSLPGETLPTYVLSFDSEITPDQLSEKFRSLPTPIIGRIENDRFTLDLRTIFPHQDKILLDSIKSILSS
ncbi:MAG: L-seryl-tRNA(Sec) selenium transferase [Candidatus Zixiibacteriota bacterium]